MLKRSTGLCFVLAVAGYFALWLLVPKATFLPVLTNIIDGLLPFSPPGVSSLLNLVGMLLVGAPTVAFMAIQIALVYFFARFDFTWQRGALVLIACLVGVVAIAELMVWQSGVAARMGRYPNLRETFYIMGAYPSVLRMPMYLLIIMAASSIGCLVSLRIKDRNLLLPVMMFAAYVDFWTVTRGPVAAVLKNAPEVAMAVAAPIPAAGTGMFVPKTMVGPGDFLFMALVFAAVYRLKLDGSRNYWFVSTGMTIGMLAVMFGFIPALPALIVLAISVFAANRRKFKLSRQELLSTAIVGVLLLASLPLVWSALNPSPEKPKPAHHGSPEGPKR